MSAFVERSLAGCVTVFAMGLAASQAQAFVQNYGNFTSANYDWLQVRESNTGVAALFGSPGISGDTVLFTPSNFKSESHAGPATTSEVVDGQLNFTINANGNATIDQFRFNERGDFTLASSGNGVARATVSCPVTLSVTEINNQTLAQPIDYSFNLIFSGGGVYIADALHPDQTGVIWTGSKVFDITAALLTDGYIGQATRVDIVLDNVLTTRALVTGGPADSADAFIAKKRFSETAVWIEVIPAPGSAALIGFGGLMSMRRRR